MEIRITFFELENIVREASQLGAVTALVRSGQLKHYLKKSEAFRTYGRANVEKWIESGLLTVRKDGNDSAAWRLDRLELETLVHSQEIWKQL